MTAPDLPTTLRSLRACDEATAWAEGKDIATAWATCERTEWMLWWLRRCDFDREALNRCNLDCMAFALDAARPRNEGKPWWPAIVDAHDRVRRAIIENRSDLPAARRAAYAAADAAVYAAAREGANYVLCAIIRKHFPTAPALKVTK